MDDLSDAQLEQLQQALSLPVQDGQNLDRLAAALIFVMACLVKAELKQRHTPAGKPAQSKMP